MPPIYANERHPQLVPIVTDINGPRFTAAEAQRWAAQQDPPFRIKFNSRVARRLTFGSMPTITLRHTVYTDGADMLIETALHEWRHVWQGMVKFRWWWLFAIAYLADVVVNNHTGSKYEDDARRWASKERIAAIAVGYAKR